MANPYGIEQIDVAGALTAMEAARSNRIRSMLIQRQIEHEDRALEQQRGVAAAFQRYTGGEGSAPSQPSASPSVAPPAAEGVPPPVMPDAAAATVPAALTAPQAQPDPLAGNREALFTSLVAIDPQQATQIMTAMHAMDEDTFTRTTRRNTAMAQEAYNLLRRPESEWAAAFQESAPFLLEHGVSRQQLAGFRLTRDNLMDVITHARDIEKIAEEARPDMMVVPQGATIAAVDRRTGQATPTYESPIVTGPGGIPYSRPPSMSTVQPGNLPLVSTPEEARQLPPGTQFRDPQGIVRTVPGGAGQSGPQTFP
jgi:hypothetical protein